MNENEFYKSMTLKLLIIITDRSNNNKVSNIFKEREAFLSYICNAIGSASSEILDMLGLSSSDKLLAYCLQPSYKIPLTMNTVAQKLEFHKAGNGIAFTVPISCASGLIDNLFREDLQIESKLKTTINNKKEVIEEQMDKEMETIRSESQHELIVASINQGFSETLMEAAKGAGATGGTLLHGRKIGLDDSIKFFGVALQTEKEMVLILTKKQKRKDIMQAINKACGIRTEARGIFFSLPADSVMGLGD